MLVVRGSSIVACLLLGNIFYWIASFLIFLIKLVAVWSLLSLSYQGLLYSFICNSAKLIIWVLSQQKSYGHTLAMLCLVPTTMKHFFAKLHWEKQNKEVPLNTQDAQELILLCSPSPKEASTMNLLEVDNVGVNFRITLLSFQLLFSCALFLLYS
jgi:hypothetical protein